MGEGCCCTAAGGALCESAVDCPCCAIAGIAIADASRTRASRQGNKIRCDMTVFMAWTPPGVLSPPMFRGLSGSVCSQKKIATSAPNLAARRENEDLLWIVQLGTRKIRRTARALGLLQGVGYVNFAGSCTFYRVNPAMSYLVSTCRMRISGYAPSQSGETESKIRRKSAPAPGLSGAAETGCTSI